MSSIVLAMSSMAPPGEVDEAEALPDFLAEDEDLSGATSSSFQSFGNQLTSVVFSD